jgi:hypothetical protein
MLKRLVTGQSARFAEHFQVITLSVALSGMQLPIRSEDRDEPWTFFLGA